MSVRYYTDLDRFPPLVLAILREVKNYIVQLLYNDEYLISPQKALSRFILSDIGAGVDISLGDYVEHFNSINPEYPFTAFSVGDPEGDNERKNLKALEGSIFCDKLNSYLSVWPMELKIPMVSFFNRADDYFIARQILHGDSMSLTKINVPITINNITFGLWVNVNYIITQGTYAAQYEQFLAKGKIWDIVHTWNITYMNFILDTTAVNEVDEIHIEVTNPDPDDPNAPNISRFSIIAPTAPKITSVSPLDGVTNVAVNSAIVITFDKAMKPNSTEDAFGILPYVPGDFTWNNDDTILTFTPHSDLDSATEYTVIVLKTAEDVNFYLEEDFEFSFTTI